MIYAVFETATGRLESMCDSAADLAPADVLQARGLDVKPLDITTYDAGGPWDPRTLTFLPREDDVPIDVDVPIDALPATGAVSIDVNVIDFTDLPVGETITVTRAIDGSLTLTKG